MNQKILSKNLKRPTAFFYPLSLKKKNKKYSEQRKNRERAHVCLAKRETKSVFEEIRTSLSLSLGVVARDDDDDDRREREREREKKSKTVQYILCLFACVKKIFFPNRCFFLPLLRFQNAPRAMRSNNNNDDTNRRERKRERERPLFPFYASKNALLGALCVCAGVHKKTILINLNTTRAQLFISFGYLICWIFCSRLFLDCFEGHVSPPVFP